MGSLRRILILVATAAVALVPLAQGFAAPADADCVLEQQAAPDQGCCGNASMSVCVLGAACLVSSGTNVTPEFQSVSPLTRPRSELGSLARAPDTAPPKTFSA
jgi:hypothetical protein